LANATIVNKTPCKVAQLVNPFALWLQTAIRSIQSHLRCGGKRFADADRAASRPNPFHSLSRVAECNFGQILTASHRPLSPIPGQSNMLSESHVENMIRELLNNPNRNEETFDKAEELLDELRPESPLRHRLMMEIEELRKMAAANG
ncbi:MAG: hypothetical protein AAFP90_12085, partial [Planctomycetota bacterium]